MAPLSRVYDGGDRQEPLNGTKFVLISIQLLLLFLIFEMKENHVYWYGLGQQHSQYNPNKACISTYCPGGELYISAQNQLKAALIVQVAFILAEFLSMLVGISILFPELTFLQCFLHFLGCMFTLWFLLDSWQYKRIWYLFSLFGFFPFLIEMLIVSKSLQFTSNI